MAEPTIAELLSRLEEQQARIDWLMKSAESNASAVDTAAPPADEPGPVRMSRRGMLMTAAAGTAGLVGGMLVDAHGAAAAPANAAPATFTSNTATPTITATNKGSGNAVAAIAAAGSAVHATMNGKGAPAVAVRGTIKPTNGLGAGVLGEAPAGTGVSGTSVSGNGVTGSSGSGTGVAGTSTTGVAVTGTTASTASGATAVEGIVSSSSPGGYSAGVYGQNNGTGGSGIGVYGAQNGFGWGVYGTTPSGYGVYGYSSSGNGVRGGSSSGTGVYASSTSGVGVEGYSSSNNAVQGTSGSGTGVEGSSSSGYGMYGSSPSNYAIVGVTTSGNGVYGQVSVAPQAGVVGRSLDNSGNWAIYGFGNIGATGTKSAVVEAADGQGHMTLYCVESPECWFEDFGAGSLKNGKVTVPIDPEFAQTIETDTYHVFVQAEGDCNGMIVTAKSATGFTVKETGGGTSSAPFSYRIVARRTNVVAPRLNRINLPEVPHASLRVPETLPHSPASQQGN